MNTPKRREWEKRKRYAVSDLYMLTTYRKVRSDYETTRYITEYFVGRKKAGKYYEFFSELELKESYNFQLSEFDTLFITDVKPLHKYEKSSTINKQGIFNLLLKQNALERVVADIME